MVASCTDEVCFTPQPWVWWPKVSMRGRHNPKPCRHTSWERPLGFLSLNFVAHSSLERLCMEVAFRNAKNSRDSNYLSLTALFWPLLFKCMVTSF
ncbi:hypothetical protein VNO77_15179 [Canavalia gladiata]|uniref:Uncharacterized protein n=1 Tax=Canavalia gladiata TaxID=3824 RepID=A0AAN9QR95_CANGL